MNGNRNVTLDVAKGLVLLMLPGIHSTLFYSTIIVQQSLFGEILAFLAENAAPVFLLVMGIAVTLGRRKPAGQILQRALRLFLLGYLLNFLKFVLPALWNGLPAALFLENGLTMDGEGYGQLLMIDDILQLAGISYCICACLYKIKKYPLIGALLVLLVVVACPLVWQVSVNSQLRFVLNYFNGRPPMTFFPVFPWLAYPLAGIIIGYLMKCRSEKAFFSTIGLTGLSLVGLGVLLYVITPSQWSEDFYRLGPAGCILHLGLALLFLCLCAVLGRLPLPGALRGLLYTLSRHVTLVYIVQWVLVCWLLPFFGYHQQGYIITAIAILLMMTLTVSFTYIYAWFIRRLADQSASEPAVESTPVLFLKALINNKKR